MFLSDRLPVYPATSTHSEQKVLAYPVLPWNLYQCLSFENSCGLREWVMVSMSGFCAVLLCRVVDFSIAFLARWTWKWFGRWSMVSIPYEPVEGISQSLLAYVCLWVGWGVKFECHVCWGWAYRLLSSMVHAVSLQMLGLRWYRVLRWMFLSDALLWLTGCSKMTISPRDKQMKWIDMT